MYISSYEVIELGLFLLAVKPRYICCMSGVVLHEQLAFKKKVIEKRHFNVRMFVRNNEKTNKSIIIYV